MSAVKYLVIPADQTSTWGEIFEHAETKGVRGNDFINSRQFKASTGALVFKLDTE